MHYMKSYYTLEKHLKLLGEENNEFNVLNSTWHLNKKSVPSALSNISFNFPHYSLHDKSHSNTIIRNIESFLGEERIKNLSPSDTWLILMAAYTHDIGMVVFSKSIEEKWSDGSFNEFLQELSFKKNDYDLSDAAKLLLVFRNAESEKVVIDKSDNPIKIRRALILVSAEYFRKIHHIRSKDIITGKDSEFRELLSNFYSDLIPRRFTEILGNIAYSHGAPFDFILNNLEYEDNGIASDKIHPRLIACLLKLGDLLDVDDLRFDLFSEKVLDKSLPVTAQNHKQKHSSIKHLRIVPDSIEITIDCENRSVYRIARHWFDWLEYEVENQSKEWTQIAPKDLSGLPPIISKGKIKVLFDGAEPKRELLDLRFSIKPERAIEIFEGGGIYEDTEFVFFRELTQNAIDANKIQLWKDITRGIYDSILIDHLKLQYSIAENASTSEIVRCIKFPHDIPYMILKNYQVDLSLDWDEIDKDILIVKVKDRGCGISEMDLLRLVNAVGESRSKDHAYLSFKESMPYWLKPTGAFGLGMQSVFLVANTFTIFTKSEDSLAMEIVFNTSKNGEYSYLKKDIPEISRGSIVEVRINRKDFDTVFDTTFPGNIVSNYDYFTDNEDIYIHKIKNYLMKQLGLIDDLNIYLPRKIEIKKSIYREYPNLEIKPIINSNQTLSIKTILNSFEEVVFIIDENICIGSQISVEVLSDFTKQRGNKYYPPHSNDLYFVRDIPIKDNQYGFWRLPYFAISWNFLNPESDKILNIARSKMISKTKDIHNSQFIRKIIPQVIPIMWNKILNYRNGNLNNVLPEKIAIILFHIKLTAIINGVSLDEDYDFEEIEFPDNIIFNCQQNRKILLKDFFKLEKIMVVDFSKSFDRFDLKNPNRIDPDSLFSEYLTKYKSNIINVAHINNVDAILFYENYLDIYLGQNFVLTNYDKIDINEKENIKMYTLLRCAEDKHHIVKMPSDMRKIILKEAYKESKRSWHYPIEPYSDILTVKNNKPSGFEIFGQFSRTSMVSPFKDKRASDNLKEQLKSLVEKNDRNYLVQVIKSDYINSLIPEKMQNWIIEHSVLKREISKEEILQAYSELIAEFLLNEYE